MRTQLRIGTRASLLAVTQSTWVKTQIEQAHPGTGHVDVKDAEAVQLRLADAAFEEGARVTLASAGLFAATALFGETDAELSRLLLRATFLLALGYMIAYWGGSAITQRSHLALLRDVVKQAQADWPVLLHDAPPAVRTTVQQRLAGAVRISQGTRTGKAGGG
mgnify:CR=1 FL=1